MIIDISLIIKLFILSRFVILFNYKTRSIKFFFLVKSVSDLYRAYIFQPILIISLFIFIEIFND